jgi:hypothetical protein
MSNFKFSKFIKKSYFWIFSIIILLYSFNRVSHNPRSVIWSDSEGYYKYLPGLFVIQDIHKIPEGSIWPTYNDKGEYMIKYSSGVAILQLPFFLVGLLIQVLLGINYHDIFNDYYAWSVQIAGLFYGLLGIYLLKDFLKSLNTYIQILTISAVLFGTNFFYYLTNEAGMSHVYSFFLLILFVRQTKTFYIDISLKKTIFIGLTLGLITLIRPTNILIFLLFAFWDINSFEDFKNRILLFSSKWHLILVIGICSFIVFIPQFFYWYEMTGNWIFYSYTEEGFNYLKSPKFLDILFDTRNGLFIFTPMALLYFAALYKTLSFKEIPSKSILFITIIWMYLFASWWCWWFGGSLGYRSFIEIYALLSIPLGYYLQYLWKHSKIKLTVISLFIGLFCYYNIAITRLYISSGKMWDQDGWVWEKSKIDWIIDEIF